MIRTIPDDLRLTLVYNNLKPKGALGDATVNQITNNIGQYKTLQFTIKQTIFQNGETVAHPSFDGIKVEQLVLVNDYGYYIIKNINRIEDAEGIKKVVNCVSLEAKLAKKMIILTHRVIQLKSNELDDEEGILDIFERETGWRVAYLDENAQYDFINGGKSLKYRNLEVSETWYNFMTVTLQEAFDVVVYFNHLDREISIYDRKTLGKDSKLILSRRNYLDSISKTSDNAEIVTRLYVEGEEGVSIHAVNPLGTGYVENFSYFANSEYMSKELIEALELYYPTLDELQVEWMEEQDVLLEMQSVLIDLNTELGKLKEELKAKKHLQTEALKDVEGNPDNEKLKELKALIDKLEQDIVSKEEEIKAKEGEVEAQTEILRDVSSRMAKENIECQGEKIFTEETLDELENFIMEGSWQSTYHSSDLTLYYGGLEQLEKINKPTFDLSVGLNQLALNIFQATAITSELYDLGDFVIVENNESSIHKKVKYIYHPILKGTKKYFKMRVSEEGLLYTEPLQKGRHEEVIVQDIIGRNLILTVDDCGSIYVSETNKTQRYKKYRMRDKSGKIYKINIQKDNRIVLDEACDNILSDFEKVRITGYSYVPETKQTTLTLSTREFSLTNEGKIGNALNSAINSGKVLEKNKLTIEQAKVNANWIEEYYKNALDVAMKEIISAYGNNKISIDENGILLQDIRDLNSLVLLSCAGVIMSDDGLESVRTAISGSGIVAEELVGQVIMGKKCYIADEKGELEIQGNLMTIYDNLKRARVKIGEYQEGVYGIEIRDAETGVVAINSKGSLQRERMTFQENLDNANPYNFFIPLDEGLSEIRQAELWLEPSLFRAYSKAVAGGGAVVGTTEANSDQTSRPSSMTTSKVNINSGGNGGYGNGDYGTGWARGWGGSGGQLSLLNGGTHGHPIMIRQDSVMIPVYGEGVPATAHVLCRKYKCQIGLSSGLGEVYYVAKSTDPQFIFTGYNETITYGVDKQGLTQSEQDEMMEKTLSPIFKEATGIPYESFREYYDNDYEIKAGVKKVSMLSSSNELGGMSKEDIDMLFERGVASVYAVTGSTHTHDDFNHYHSNQHSHNMDHTHTVSAHSHSVKLGDHEHAMIFGIWKDTEVTKPTVSLWGRLLGGSWEKVYENINVTTKLDLKPFLDRINEEGKENMVEFEVRANTRARVTGSFLMKSMTRY